MKFTLIQIIALVLLIGGCSQKAVYQATQESLKYQCMKLPDSQYDDCMERAGKTYEEYDRERKIVIEK